jgi:N-acetylmuramoyl-L-alanine amidase
MATTELLYWWAVPLDTRKATNYIILHHVAGSGFTPQQIHQMHIDKGWAGIGYHYYVRKDGTVYRGRPIDKVGAQCQGYNEQSIGICAEGNFETEVMGEAQQNAVASALREALSFYPQAKVVRHSVLNETACPGTNYPFDAIVTLASSNPTTDAIRALQAKDIIVSPDYWMANAVQGGACKGEYVAQLIRNFASKI